jgi:arabinogalactan endo-1,4-beta-galactosidase
LILKASLDERNMRASYSPIDVVMDKFKNVLNQIGDKYSKKTMVLENSYAYTLENSDFHPNTISSASSKVANYDFSLQGQVNQVVDVIETLSKVDSALGYCYWEGTWISVNKGSYSDNKKIWEEFGSGWASSYSKEYDSEDAGKYYGGCAVENQAFFDDEGRVLESLKLFKLISIQ